LEFIGLLASTSTPTRLPTTREPRLSRTTDPTGQKTEPRPESALRGPIPREERAEVPGGHPGEVVEGAAREHRTAVRLAVRARR